MPEGKKEDAADIAHQVTVGMASLKGVALVFTLVVSDEESAAVMRSPDLRYERGSLKTNVSMAPREPTLRSLAIAVAAMRHYADEITRRLQASGHQVLKAQPVKAPKGARHE